MSSQRDKLSLTVVIPAYNASKTVVRAVESAFKAGAERVVVVDDGSSDETLDVATMTEADAIHQGNAGAFKARVAGLNLARTEYVIFLDADDTLVEDGVREAVKHLAERDDASGVVGRYLVRVDEGDAQPARKAHVGLSFSALIELGFAPGPPGVIVWRRHFLSKADAELPPPLATPFAEDYELILRGAWCASLLSLEAHMCVYSLGSGRSYAQFADEDRHRRCIQTHYATIAGIEPPNWSPRLAASARLLRFARLARYSGKGARALLLGSFATLLDPPLVKRAVAGSRRKR